MIDICFRVFWSIYLIHSFHVFDGRLFLLGRLSLFWSTCHYIFSSLQTSIRWIMGLFSMWGTLLCYSQIKLFCLRLSCLRINPFSRRNLQKIWELRGFIPRQTTSKIIDLFFLKNDIKIWLLKHEFYVRLFIFNNYIW